jgi:hypothetical protein
MNRLPGFGHARVACFLVCILEPGSSPEAGSAFCLFRGIA